MTSEQINVVCSIVVFGTLYTGGLSSMNNLTDVLAYLYTIQR
ncbi:MAG: hypothetical protein RI985_1578 [Chloroflexota bacterium]|jgi:hypothetical protein